MLDYIYIYIFACLEAIFSVWIVLGFQPLCLLYLSLSSADSGKWAWHEEAKLLFPRFVGVISDQRVHAAAGERAACFTERSRKHGRPPTVFTWLDFWTVLHFYYVYAAQLPGNFKATRWKSTLKHCSYLRCCLFSAVLIKWEIALTKDGLNWMLKSCIVLLWSSVRKTAYSGLSGSRYVITKTD